MDWQFHERFEQRHMTEYVIVSGTLRTSCPPVRTSAFGYKQTFSLSTQSGYKLGRRLVLPNRPS